MAVRGSNPGFLCGADITRSPQPSFRLFQQVVHSQNTHGQRQVAGRNLYSGYVPFVPATFDRNPPPSSLSPWEPDLPEDIRRHLATLSSLYISTVCIVRRDQDGSYTRDACGRFLQIQQSCEDFSKCFTLRLDKDRKKTADAHLVKTGIIGLLCHVMVEGLESDDHVAEGNPLHVSLEILVNTFCEPQYYREVWCRVGDDARLLPVLVNKLRDWYRPHMDNTLTAAQEMLLHVIRHSTVSDYKCREKVRQLDAVDVLLPYITSVDCRSRHLAAEILDFIITEREEDKVASEEFWVAFYDTVGKDYSAADVLARNSTIGRVLVKKGAVPVLMERVRKTDDQFTTYEFLSLLEGLCQKQHSIIPPLVRQELLNLAVAVYKSDMAVHKFCRHITKLLLAALRDDLERAPTHRQLTWLQPSGQSGREDWSQREEEEEYRENGFAYSHTSDRECFIVSVDGPTTPSQRRASADTARSHLETRGEVPIACSQRQTFNRGYSFTSSPSTSQPRNPPSQHRPPRSQSAVEFYQRSEQQGVYQLQHTRVPDVRGIPAAPSQSLRTRLVSKNSSGHFSATTGYDSPSRSIPLTSRPYSDQSATLSSPSAHAQPPCVRSQLESDSASTAVGLVNKEPLPVPASANDDTDMNTKLRQLLQTMEARVRSLEHEKQARCSTDDESTGDSQLGLCKDRVQNNSLHTPQWSNRSSITINHNRPVFNFNINKVKGRKVELGTNVSCMPAQRGAGNTGISDDSAGNIESEILSALRDVGQEQLLSQFLSPSDEDAGRGENSNSESHSPAIQEHADSETTPQPLTEEMGDLP
ncbi:hypothetical protein BaRGS_00040404 [Batillaria attramentaria]|uniref:Uncharacterized protein n=1 Tax=Batillaria attramentaria TaxID=370345 RepID=A0ABD0J0I2_9CAEN